MAAPTASTAEPATSDVSPASGAAARSAGTTSPSAPDSSAGQTRCTERPEQEQPVHDGTMGQGDRLIRVLNRTGVPVRLRLLSQGGEPALAGTLHIPKTGQGELRVAPGSYRVRYRLESSCEVLLGSPIALTGNRAGVEIQLRAGSNAGSGSVQHVGGVL
jgi:hypothetical protein